MALNVKAATLICMGFIGVISWIARQVEVPQVEVTSPLVVGAAPVDFARTAGALASRGVEWRAGLAQRLERPNAIERQAEQNRAEMVTLAAWSPGDPVAEHPAPVELPPLAYRPPEAVTLANPTDAGRPVEVSEPVLVAVGDEATGWPGAEPAARREPRRYRVARGDTLYAIARREWNSDDRRLVALLAEVNPKLAQRRGGRILVGEELLIPDAATAERVLAGEAATPTVVATREVGAATASGPWYTIRRNDTLAGIAQRFLNDSRRWREIVELNGQLNPHQIFPGTRIKLPPVLGMARG